MKRITTITTALLLILNGFLSAQSAWPREILLKNGKVIMYQPQSDSLKGDHLYSRVAISITAGTSSTPVFGALWTDSKFSTDRETGMCTIYNLKILNVRFPGIDTIDKAKLAGFKKALEEEGSSWKIDFSLDELKSSLDLAKAAISASSNLKNDAPEIIYRKQSSVLVLFDGDPVWKDTGEEGLKRAINTPFLVLQDGKDKNCYLFGGQFWYKSADPVKSSWLNIAKPSSTVEHYYNALKKEAEKSGKSQPQTAQKSADGKQTTPPAVVVRTKQAELIQSTGEAQYAPIQGTQILYMTNTSDNIFMTIDKNQYYVLLSGRWYRSATLAGPWSFVESDNLPEDFAKIPEGSEKDIVLASIAGTDAAKDAVLDAQIPQTAAVDRKTAKCEVKWDGDPKFEKIKGTDIARGMNTSSTVLLFSNVYYVCDNAVWFTCKGPAGPWVVATSVPEEFQRIPPDDPAYNVKYVYIYDVEPEVVYVGYTPGYTGCYIYGPTVVYGTGYPYPPFYGPYYYPRPVTFGFSMHYNPWYGWSMGMSMSYGMFSVSFGGPMGYPGGCWGPPMYRPPYGHPYNHYYGPRPPSYRGGGNTININNNYNFYNNRSDHSARPSQQPAVSPRPSTGNNGGNRPSAKPGASTQPAGNDRTGNQRPSTQPAGRPGAAADGRPTDRSTGQNNVFTDRNGDVYRNNNGDWQKNNGKNWESAKPSTRDAGTQNRSLDRSGFNQQEMNRQNQARERGNQNAVNRSSAQPSNSGSRPAGGGGGGGNRSGGGGGGGGRRR